MQASKKILFFGNERLATGVKTNTPIIKALVSNGYDVMAVVTTSSHINPSRKLRESEIESFASYSGIPLLQFERLNSAIDQLKKFGAIVGVLASFGKMVPDEVIKLFPFGIINIHPSLLPLHRGPTPIESTILAGEKKTGVSLMKLVSEMDAGPLYDQVEIQLQGDESKQQLADRLGELGAKRLVSVLPQIFSGKHKPLAQTGPVSYDKRLESTSGALDLNLPAINLERAIRAYYGWPRSRTVIKGQPVIITKAHVLAADDINDPGELKVLNGSLELTTVKDNLVIDRLIPAGSKEMSSQDYLRGRKI